MKKNDSELLYHEKVERSIMMRFHKQLWTPFVRAIKEYKLITPGDKIAVCISGGKDSMLMAKLFQELKRHNNIPFELVFLVMDPGYNDINRKKIEHNAEILNVPITIFESNIFKVASSMEKNPCYICARMRRGALYAKAKELGCNKIALGHHFSDVIETTLMSILYGAQVQAMLPKLHSDNFENMELIRPMYCIHEDDIIKWKNHNGLEFIQCACKLTDGIANSEDGIGTSKRQEVKILIKRLMETNPYVEKNIFASIHCVALDTIVGYKYEGVLHSFLDDYDTKNEYKRKKQ